MRTKTFVLSAFLLLALALFTGALSAQAASGAHAEHAGAVPLLAFSGATANSAFLADIAASPVYTPVRYCGRLWIRGHYNRYGRWIPGHMRYRHWVGGHYNRYGRWRSGHCA